MTTHSVVSFDHDTINANDSIFRLVPNQLNLYNSGLGLSHFPLTVVLN